MHTVLLLEIVSRSQQKAKVKFIQASLTFTAVPLVHRKTPSPTASSRSANGSSSLSLSPSSYLLGLGKQSLIRVSSEPSMLLDMSQLRKELSVF